MGIKSRHKIIFFTAVVLVIISNTDIAKAAGFNASRIISDEEMYDYKSITLGEIYTFLRLRDSRLSTEFLPDIDGVKRSAPYIIFQSALKYEINPKVLLVMIQKEQSLIEARNPTIKQFDWAAGYGVCDTCNPDDPSLAVFKGFGRQIDLMAGALRRYREKSSEFTYQVNKLSRVDGSFITPENQATASLYNYTPHFAGNRLFWQLWNKYWVDGYPDGTLLQAKEDDEIYYIKDGTKKKIGSLSVLLSRFNPKNIIEVVGDELDRYEEGKSIKIPNYSLIRDEFGKVFLVVDNTVRYITSPEVFKNLGYHPEEVMDVTKDDISEYTLGQPINESTAFPAGVLLQDAQTGGVYFVQDGKKHPVPSREVLLSTFPDKPISQVSSKTLSQYPTAPAVQFKEGELVKAEDDSAVYFVSDGKLRPFLTGDAFESLGFNWDNVLITTRAIIDLHPLGSFIE